MLRISSRSLSKPHNPLKLSRNFHKIQSEQKTIKIPKCSKTIRREFLDYFLDLDHKIIPSSRVAPIFDPSVAFTNAGMNQFKRIFLEELEPPHSRVVNHQKCVRVGGKHNDLKAVGMDNYHHTFFEMLGNWSFGDYGRREACAYAWGLLTGPFGIPKERLYVTYFSGDSSLNLPPDLETKETWLSLGLQPSHVLPSGLQDNFWEMSLTGPCGPCTEIHVNTSHNLSASPPNPSDLKELWNLVFIEHQRLQDSSIQPLRIRHVDTGMGFERLVAVLQGKDSNYDTDLFLPLFDAIRTSSSAPPYLGKFGDADESGLDTGYRILADHARMITICISDGMIPEENHKLRRVIRKSINVGTDVFRREKLLSEVCCHVAETLGDVYPEVSKSLKKVQTIVEYEEDLLKVLKSSSGKMWRELVKERPELGDISDPYASGLVQGYKELRKGLLEGGERLRAIPGELGFKLYDTYGLHPELIEELAEVEGVEFDREEFEEKMKEARVRSRVGVTQGRLSEGCLEGLGEGTDDSGKYRYWAEGEGYGFEEVPAKVLGILVDGKLIEEKSFPLNSSLKTKQIGVILDKTAFYTPEGGQLSDKGHLMMKNLVFNVSEVQKLQDYVIHVGSFDPSNFTEQTNELSINDDVKLSLDKNHRVSMMRHHTATHLLNSALRKVFPAISQRGSIVRHDNLIFQFSAYGKAITPEIIKSIETLINDCIDAKVPVKTKIVDSIGFNREEELVLVPGMIYPGKHLRIVEIDGNHLKSKEACCGTHVHNTSALNHFRIIEVTSKGSSSRTITAVAGPQVRNLPSTILEQFSKVPLVAPEASKNVNERREMAENFMNSEINYAVKNTNENFVVHCLQSNSIEADGIPLQKAGELSPEKPIFIIAKGRRKVKARCFVPQNCVTKDFNAELWMRSVNNVMKSTIGSFADENPLLTSHVKVFKLPRAEIDSRVNESLEEAKDFALKNCKKS
ncbi:alanine--tRNA ligase, mitochondrial [Diachasma alloeum]|uniref:alanine--tRNA ligase, mitochondrial n=1 Tax=Diachasma alloeum TaxID=454923 RepID=UPI0007383770|nr:alanine--tRNA ligase, mitochondrial [Diachasma alloeum]